ncbi:MAG: RNA pseudouridine synthase [Muribaculaceae bacterium]|nr:RNA pseudouridine synthase [Roseburia sp.]MCM1431393.1 RNA pseudouridine synthase [Muribaculaceae bacterium]MCM1491835.1 RNA pseudouridine synthase [Muribaculaceae bacterium]
MNWNKVYEDSALVVCYKPAGIPTQTKHIGRPDMVSLLKNDRALHGEPSYVGLVHRLDQPVEGLLVFGKTKEAAARLSGQVQAGSFGKYYYALGQGSKPEASGREEIFLIDYILADKKKNTASVVPEGTRGAKKAVLQYRVVGNEGDRICFDITLHSGRHHQIRLQMAHHGWPLLGDRKYGVGTEQGQQLALCAYRITFTHPETGNTMDFSIQPQNPAFASFCTQPL